MPQIHLVRLNVQVMPWSLISSFFGRNKIICLVFLLGTFDSAFSQVESNDTKKFVKTIDLKLDSETARPSHFGSTFQYCKDVGSLAYLNSISRSIKYYDLESGLLVGETKFNREGPDAVPGDPFYFYYHNKDSIFVFSEFQNSRLFLIDSKGTKINTFDFSSDDDYRTVPFPRLARVSGGIVVIGSHFYLAFNVSGQEHRNKVSPVLRYNMKSNEFNYLTEPKGYAQLDINKLPKVGQFRFYESRIARGNTPGSIVINFPLNHDLYVSKDDWVRSVKAQSDYVDKFEFLSKNKERYDLKNIEYKKVVFGSARYFGIFHDGERQLYYRLAKIDNAEKWKSKYSSNSKKGVLKEYTLMIFDSDFNKKSEVKFNLTEALPEKGVFVGPGGLWMLLPDKGNEDIMTVGLLKTYE